jgi:hypothetical protein
MSPLEQERIAGAKAMLDRLKESKLIIEAQPFESTTEGYYRRRDWVFEQLMSAVGPLSPKAAGAVGALVDLAIDSISNGYSMNEQIDGDFVPAPAPI